MRKIAQYIIISSLACIAFGCADSGPSSSATPTIVTQDNFPQAFTNMRLGSILKKTGGVNKFFAMPVPSSIPAEQFVVRMNRDTPYSVAVIDMSGDNVYVTVPESPYFDTDDSYEVTFVDPKAKYFWSATVYNGDGRMFNDKANISSEMNPVKNADGTYTLRFGCDGQPNNIPIREGNTTGKFNVLLRHYGPGAQVSNGEDGYDCTKLIRRVDK